MAHSGGFRELSGLALAEGPTIVTPRPSIRERDSGLDPDGNDRGTISYWELWP